MKEVKDGSENCSPVIVKCGSAELRKGCALKVSPSTLLTSNRWDQLSLCATGGGKGTTYL